MDNAERRFTLSPGQIRRMNPNTRTAPVFRSRADARLTAQIYEHVPVLIDDSCSEGNPWGATFHTRIWHMAEDSEWFRTAEQVRSSEQDYLPLYEAKMIHQFDHRWSTYSDKAETRDVELSEKQDPGFEPVPRYWVPSEEVRKRFSSVGWQRQWLMGWRDITSAHVLRTVIADIIPAYGCGNKFLLIFPGVDAKLCAALLGCLNSLTLDFVARQKLGGNSLMLYILKQLPVLPPSAYRQTALEFIVPRVLELIYTSHSMAPFARDLGYNGQPFGWDEARRALLRAELDAWYARAYGLTRDELRYILDPADVKGEDYPSETFRVLKNSENKNFGEYRTRRLVLDAWDRFARTEAPEFTPLAIPAYIPLPSMLPDGAWAMPSYNKISVQLQLAAILKKLEGPTSADRVRLAAIYALHPSYLTPLLSNIEGKEWQRLVADGANASVAASVVNFVSRMNVEWRDAYTQLRGIHALVEDSQNETWAPGSAVREFLTEGWPDGRAEFVLKALEGMNIEESITTLPTDVQAWVRGHAA